MACRNGAFREWDKLLASVEHHYGLNTESVTAKTEDLPVPNGLHPEIRYHQPTHLTTIRGEDHPVLETISRGDTPPGPKVTLGGKFQVNVGAEVVRKGHIRRMRSGR